MLRFTTLQVDEPEKHQSQFSEIVKRGVEADGLEELYKEVHAAIRAYPVPRKSEEAAPKQHKRFSLKKLTYDERKASLIKRLSAQQLELMTMMRMKMTSEDLICVCVCVYMHFYKF